MRRTSAFGFRTSAFSLVELLVVIGIIAVLIGVLIPTVRKVRIAGQEADTKALLNQLDQACLNYYQTFNGYPGPLPAAALTAATQPPLYDVATGGTAINLNAITTPGTATTETMFGPTGQRVTASENLVLGLCGGLALDRTTGRIWFDAASVGQGPANLNALKPGRTTAFMQPVSLSTGQFAGESGAVVGIDSKIPEFIDKFATPMPFLYMRSQNNGASAAGAETLVVNNATAAADYNIVEIQPYTSYPTGGTAQHGLKTANPAKSITPNPTISGVSYQTPYDAYDYFVDPASYDRSKTTLTAADYAGKRSRKRDSYVLISAGRDRVYGTADDITNFGSVLP